MIPQLFSATTSGEVGPPTSTVPPPHFRPIVGPITHIHIQDRDYTRSQGLTAAQQRGLVYEAKVQRFLLDLWHNYRAGQWIRFIDDGAMRQCQPDGLLFSSGVCFIFEIKFQHCPEAWWQLEKLYKQVLGKLYQCPISLVEICRTYDPATPFPCPVTLIDDLASWVENYHSDFGVFQWRK